jgi:hypothetical protein
MHALFVLMLDIFGYSDFDKNLKVAMLHTFLNQQRMSKTIFNRHFPVFEGFHI